MPPRSGIKGDSRTIHQEWQRRRRLAVYGTMNRAFVFQRRVQFAETDLAGVLHFSNYFRMMEEAEHAMWRSLDSCVVTEIDGKTISWPRVSAECEYLAPARFEDELQIALRVTEIGTQSITLEAEFRCRDRCIARARTKAVCCTMTNDRFAAIPIPPAIREKLDALRNGTD